MLAAKRVVIVLALVMVVVVVVVVVIIAVLVVCVLVVVVLVSVALSVNILMMELASIFDSECVSLVSTRFCLAPALQLILLRSLFR